MSSWKGYYELDGVKTEMRLKKFKVKGNKISGNGDDEIGEFDIIGDYNAEHKVSFIKQYKGAHQVHYNGEIDGQSISGHWEVNGLSGKFNFSNELHWAGQTSTMDSKTK